MSEPIEEPNGIAGRRRWLQLSLGSLAMFAGCAPRSPLGSGATLPATRQATTSASASQLSLTPVGGDVRTNSVPETYETSLGQAWVESHVNWPTIQLSNQQASSIDLYRDLVAQRQVVINFFYTRCSGNCPVTMGRMIKLARSLSPAERQATTFISVSLDAKRERPEDLASYARSVLPEDVDWQFLCGPQETVDGLRRYLGFYELNEATDAIPRSHASMVLFGNDQSHRWIALPAVSTFRQWRSVLARVSA